jgi:hypothetical protein
MERRSLMMKEDWECIRRLPAGRRTASVQVVDLGPDGAGLDPVGALADNPQVIIS